MATTIVVSKPPTPVTVVVRERSATSVTAIRQGIPGRSVTQELYQYVYNTPMAEWRVLHNKNTTFIRVDCYTTDGSLFFAPITIIDSNEFVISFSRPLAGFMNVTYGGQADITVITGS